MEEQNVRELFEMDKPKPYEVIKQGGKVEQKKRNADEDELKLLEKELAELDIYEDPLKQESETTSATSEKVGKKAMKV